MNRKIAAILPLWLLLTESVCAATRIAVLDFELNDISSLPNTDRERQRTASIRPLLEQAVGITGDYEIVRIDTGVQSAANAGFGYLFRFPDLAADLGRQYQSDWIIVGQHSKPSYLFSYLRVLLVDVKKRALRARFSIELKGNHESVTRHAVKASADKILEVLAHP